jgi:hypothetical protein
MSLKVRNGSIAFCLFSILCVISFGQTPVIRWSGQYPASPEADASYSPEDIIEVSDGIVICGIKTVQVGSNPSHQYVYIMKLNMDGEVIWANTYDFDNPVEGYESYEYAKSIIQNDQGNFYVVGYQSLPPFPVSEQPSRPQGRVLIMEIMANGTLGRYEGVADTDSLAEAGCIRKTSDNAYVFTGRGVTYDANGHGDDHILLGEFTGTSLTPEFVVSFPYDGDSPGWGEWVHTMTPDAQNAKFIVAGNTIENKFDIFLLNADDIGWVEWRHVYGGPENDHLSGVLTIGDYYYLVGSSETLVEGTSFYYYKAYVAKVDREGNLVDENTYGGTGTYFANDVNLAPDGDLVITGTHENKQTNTYSIYAVKVDPETLEQEWLEEYQVNSGARAAMHTSDFGLIIGGRSIISGVPEDQMFLMYLDQDDGVATAMFSHTDLSLALVNTSDNIDVITASDLEGNLYGVSVTITELVHPAVENLEIFLEHGATSVKLVAQGNASGENFVNTHFMDAAENPITIGAAPYTATYKPAEPLHAFNGTDPKGDWTLRILDHTAGGMKSTTGTLNGWTLKLLTDAGSSTGIDSPAAWQNMAPLLIFPNPVSGETSIQFNISTRTHVELSIYNQAGLVVEKLVDAELNTGSHTRIWNTEKIAPGTYFVQLNVNGAVHVSKLVVAR